MGLVSRGVVGLVFFGGCNVVNGCRYFKLMGFWFSLGLVKSVQVLFRWGVVGPYGCAAKIVMTD